MVAIVDANRWKAISLIDPFARQKWAGANMPGPQVAWSWQQFIFMGTAETRDSHCLSRSKIPLSPPLD